jgi:hypothetical protein
VGVTLWTGASFVVYSGSGFVPADGELAVLIGEAAAGAGAGADPGGARPRPPGHQVCLNNLAATYRAVGRETDAETMEGRTRRRRKKDRPHRTVPRAPGAIRKSFQRAEHREYPAMQRTLRAHPVPVARRRGVVGGGGVFVIRVYSNNKLVMTGNEFVIMRTDML